MFLAAERMLVPRSITFTVAALCLLQHATLGRAGNTPEVLLTPSSRKNVPEPTNLYVAKSDILLCVGGVGTHRAPNSFTDNKLILAVS